MKVMKNINPHCIMIIAFTVFLVEHLVVFVVARLVLVALVVVVVVVMLYIKSSVFQQLPRFLSHG